MTENVIQGELKKIFKADYATKWCIYIFFSLRNNKTGHIRIINFFPSCYVLFCFFYKIKRQEKKNRTSSELMDKIN